MGFHNYPLEPARPLGDGGIVGSRNRSPIEEAAAIVELEMFCARHPLERVIDLRGNRPEGLRFGGGVLPEIAHEAAPGAFAVRQENRRYLHQLTGLCWLALHQECPGPERVKLVSRRPA